MTDSGLPTMPIRLVLVVFASERGPGESPTLHASIQAWRGKEHVKTIDLLQDAPLPTVEGVVVASVEAFAYHTGLGVAELLDKHLGESVLDKQLHLIADL